MKELKIVEFKNERIITTKVLAESYGTDENNITKNFNNNKDRFVEGKHYYYLTGDELKEFKNLVNDIHVVSKNTPSLYLWTEKGILRHSKILDTDEAWSVYEELEDTYFKVKNNQLQLINNDLTNQINEIVQAKIDQIENKCSEYYRPTALTKYSISKYIKDRLGISKANDEYELVKLRVLIILGAKAWQDLPIEVLQNSLPIIDECIDVIRKDRPQQLSLI